MPQYYTHNITTVHAASGKGTSLLIEKCIEYYNTYKLRRIRNWLKRIVLCQSSSVPEDHVLGCPLELHKVFKRSEPPRTSPGGLVATI